MRLRSTTRSVVMITVLSATFCLPAAAQPQPFGSRGSLIFTEISPYSPASPPGVVAWLEIHNPTSDPVPLEGLEVERADGTHYEVPSGTGGVHLQSGGFLVVRFDAVGLPSAEDLHGNIIVHAPTTLAADWLPPRGELALFRQLPPHPGDPSLEDHVAWGVGAAERAALNKPPRWHRGSFVELAENFGVYDPDTTLLPGASIGLYPGSTTSTPADWVIFDPDEVTPGHPNRVPRPKGFTLADGAEIGSQSFAVGWTQRKGDQWYRFQLATDPAFGGIVADEVTSTPVIRLGDASQVGERFYRVTALAAGSHSQPSIARRSYLFRTSCDWPLLPTPFIVDRKQKLQDWIENPACIPERDCKIIKKIEFKFQRKDSPLECGTCDAEQVPACPSMAPHPYCHEVTFSNVNGNPSFILCAGGDLSPLCGPWPLKSPWERLLEWLHDHELLPLVPWPGNVDRHLEVEQQSNVLSEILCAHGTDYCAVASISMLVSAYGGCLSQDRLQEQVSRVPSGPPHGAQGALLCGQGGPGTPGEVCTLLMEWALGNPQVDYYPSPPSDFSAFHQWVDDGRPVMSKAKDEDHIRVLSGYCADPAPQPPELTGTSWVYVYDPRTGPRAETFTSWRDSSSGTWIGPPIADWPPADGSSSLETDPQNMWIDLDGDGTVDIENSG